MSKTFRNVEDGSREFIVEESSVHGGVKLRVEDNGRHANGVIISIADAPAAALAMLEAAQGTNEACDAHVADAIHALRRYTRIREHAAKEAADRETLEAEAWEFYTAAVLARAYDSLKEMPVTTLDMWLSIARKAREMRKAKS